MYNIPCLIAKHLRNFGVWLSLARVLDLGSRGRRFESCHPDLFLSFVDKRKYIFFLAGVVQW